MGNGRVDQTQQIPLGLWRIIEDLLRDINEANHVACLITSLHLTFLDLEVLELGDKFLFNASHSAQVFDYKLYVVVLTFARIQFKGTFFVKSKDFLT